MKHTIILILLPFLCSGQIFSVGAGMSEKKEQKSLVLNLNYLYNIDDIFLYRVDIDYAKSFRIGVSGLLHLPDSPAYLETGVHYSLDNKIDLKLGLSFNIGFFEARVYYEPIHKYMTFVFSVSSLWITEF